MEKISKTKIEERLKKKVNPYLVETIIKLKKINPLLAKLIASPKKKEIKFNLDEINKMSENGESLIIAGKILGSGDLDKKVKLIALSASKQALNKMKAKKIEFSTIYENLNDSKKLKEYRILE